MKTAISVVIPLYNKEKSIARTLRSVLAQTFADFEVIVVNDGSTDNSRQAARSISDPRIAIYDTENQGVSAARNFGCARAKGDYIAFLDADDTWLPDHLEDLHRLFMRHPGCGLYATSYERDYGKGRTIIPRFTGIPKNFEGIVADFFGSSMTYRLAWTSAVAIPKNIWQEAGGFDTAITLGAGEDTDLWVRLALRYPVAFCNRITACHRLDAENRVSHADTLRRRFADFRKFAGAEKENTSLKRFLDRYRAEYALKHKLAGDEAAFRFYRDGIDNGNISRKTRLLLKLPAFLLKGLYRFKKGMENGGIATSAY